LLKGQYEAQIGLGPERVREALLSTKHLVVYWKEQIHPAKHNPNAVPNTDALIKNDLMAVRDHARLISPELAALISEVIATLRKAAGEFEKVSKGVVYSAGFAEPYLNTADSLINAAIKKLDQCEKK
jgi:hypothetical protein